MRLLLVSTHRSEEFEALSTEAYFERYPYSVGAILFNLERLGWQTRRLGIKSTAHPRKLVAAIDAFQPDIIYTYGALTALLPVWLRRCCRHRAYRVVHGWDDVYGEIWRDVYGWLPGILMNRIEKWIVRQSDGVVTLSRFNQVRGRRWGVESHYIPNGADKPQLDPTASKIRLEGRLKLVYTGDQARWKRTWEVCAAMAHLPRDIKLYLTGGHYPFMDRYASENCIFLGYLPKNDQLSVMVQADVLVLTANQDCNAKIQEYLRFEKPILGYDDRPNLFFTNGRNALLTRDYRAAILRLADDPGLRASLVENARCDLPISTWAEIAAQFDAYFKSLQPAPGGPR